MPYYGFNFLWMFSSKRYFDAEAPQAADEKALDFIAELGLNFIRIPMSYRFWTKDYDYFHPDETIWERFIDQYIEACRQRGLHINLNLHRAPGYCINANHLEKHNLWTDTEAQDAFVFLWEQFSQRYAHIPAAQLSFDLLNEPPMIGQYGMTRENHAAIMRRTAAAIRAITPERPITIDGLGGGNIPMPELSGLSLTQSCRGYIPMALTHYQASWWDGHHGLPIPTYPDLNWNGICWNMDTLRQSYQPWRQLEAGGTRVHVGEFGCYNQTPNEVALRWFKNLLSLFKEYRWGYSLWNFEGAFGIIGHNRPGVKYEWYQGYQVDRALLDLYLENRAAG